MKLFQRKWFVLFLLIAPNFVISALEYGFTVFALGSGAGAATVVFLLYLIAKTMLVKSKMKRKYIVPVSIVLSYLFYYTLMVFF